MLVPTPKWQETTWVNLGAKTPRIVNAKRMPILSWLDPWLVWRGGNVIEA
ncbi:unnamed protein product [Penicillium camemberti]|uniref:Str. FM013 n=1 Tax=Penicillium camemberti (strain FM 013) TaxID=1429867 RepID=A0A0G4NUG3_PENC3|nr:unnamed protein product [Penicillium camemberti]